MKLKTLRTKLADVIRDFVFGMEDGLVSNLGLVLGVFVGGGGTFAIVLAGLASMFAGAFSMSAGSYLSSKSQREVYEQEIKSTHKDLHDNPQKCFQEMKRLLRKEGISHKEIRVILRKFSGSHPQFVCNYLAQKKVGIFKGKLERPWKNAITMFFSFITGSVFPILPFVLFSENKGAIVAVIATAVVLFIVGSLKTIYTKRNWFKSGMEIVFVGLGAGLTGYLVGMVISLI